MMNKATFSVFYPKEKKSKKLSLSSSSLILVVLFFVAFGLIRLFHLSDELLKISSLLLIVPIALYFYMPLKSKMTYEQIEGEYKGLITLSESEINITDPELHFSLESIQNLDLILGDYEGNNISMGRNNWNPNLSDGVGNCICFTDENNKAWKFNFKLDNDNQIELFEPFIKSAARLNKLSILKATSLLKITDYDAIEEFKQNL